MNWNLVEIARRLDAAPGGVLVDQLCGEFGIRPRTFRKYKRLLEDESEALFGRAVKVELTGRGEDRRIALRDARPPDANHLLEQLGALYLAQQLLGFAAGSPLLGEIEKIAGRIAAAAPKKAVLGVQVDRLRRMVHFVPSGHKDYRAKAPLVSALFGAIIGRRRIAFRYRALAREAPEQVDAEPLSLVMYKGGLYVVARLDRRPPGDEPAILSVDRMTDLEISERTFRYPEDFDPAAYFDGSFGLFRGPKNARVRVALLFAADEPLQRYLRERTWARGEKWTVEPDGRLRMTFTVSSLAEVAPWVRSWGRAVEVLEPKGVDFATIGLGLGPRGPGG